MRETSEKFNLPTLPGLPKCIRSQALEGGPSPCDRQAGPMTGQCGQARALVKASQEPASALGSKTKDTSGRSSTASLASANLSRSLASRLRPDGGFRTPWDAAIWSVGSGFDTRIRRPIARPVPNPLESGFLPVAHGIPGNMEQLRCYGNALCVPQAQAFVEAFIDYQQSLTGEGEGHDQTRID